MQYDFINTSIIEKGPALIGLNITLPVAVNVWMRSPIVKSSETLNLNGDA